MRQTVVSLKRRWRGAALVLCLVAGAGGKAGAAVTQVAVTDVTPRSFAVIWVSDAPATGSLNLFLSDCTTPITPAVLVPEGNDATGNMKVTVGGLSPNTGYCYQVVNTDKGSGAATSYPSQPATVTTATAAIRSTLSAGKRVATGNDLVQVLPPYLPGETDTRDGIMTLISLADGSGFSPLSLLLTNDATAPLDKGYFNLNNLFDSASGQSRDLAGGERVRVTERHGRNGCTLERFRTVAADNGGVRVSRLLAPSRATDIDANGTVNILDLLRVASGIGSSYGDACYNSELDENGDNTVDFLDLLTVEGALDATL